MDGPRVYLDQWCRLSAAGPPASYSARMRRSRPSSPAPRSFRRSRILGPGRPPLMARRQLRPCEPVDQRQRAEPATTTSLGRARGNITAPGELLASPELASAAIRGGHRSQPPDGGGYPNPVPPQRPRRDIGPAVRRRPCPHPVPPHATDEDIDEIARARASPGGVSTEATWPRSQRSLRPSGRAGLPGPVRSLPYSPDSDVRGP